MNTRHIEIIKELLLELGEIAKKQNNSNVALQEFINHDNLLKYLKYNSSKKEYNIDKNFLNDYLKGLFQLNEKIQISHYTTLESLFSILKTGVIQLSSLAGLNDRGEIGFVNNFMRGYPGLLQSYNYTYIFSTSEKYDNLNQWRLYGDNGKGAMLTFEIALENLLPNFYIGRSIYGLSFFETLKARQKSFKKEFDFSFGLGGDIDVWKYLFKDTNYEDEKEVRVLYFKEASSQSSEFLNFKLNSYKLITPFQEVSLDRNISQQITKEYLPLKFNSITLGSNSFECNYNKDQLTLFIHHLQQKQDSVKNSYPQIKVNISNISSFR